jgi:Mlc titration factor MtfA (ptsG expression regulator)
LRYWVDGKPSTGIRPYAFILDQEFITVTTDMFTRSPKQLKKTQEGQDLYKMYTEFFGTDPDKDWKYDKTITANVAEDKPK